MTVRAEVGTRWTLFSLLLVIPVFAGGDAPRPPVSPSVAWEQEGEPFAPKAPIPDDVRRTPEAAMEVGTIDRARVPAKSEVGIPPYPGAVVVGSTTAEETAGMYGPDAEALPLVRLLSEDDPTEVVSFYRERLGEGWHYVEKFGSHFFWKGDAELTGPGLMAPDLVRIQISEAMDWKVMPGATSDIFVVYDPGS